MSTSHADIESPTPGPPLACKPPRNSPKIFSKLTSFGFWEGVLGARRHRPDGLDAVPVGPALSKDKAAPSVRGFVCVRVYAEPSRRRASELAGDHLGQRPSEGP